MGLRLCFYICFYPSAIAVQKGLYVRANKRAFRQNKQRNITQNAADIAMGIEANPGGAADFLAVGIPDALFLPFRIRHTDDKRNLFLAAKSGNIAVPGGKAADMRA